MRRFVAALSGLTLGPQRRQVAGFQIHDERRNEGQALVLMGCSPFEFHPSLRAFLKSRSLATYHGDTESRLSLCLRASVAESALLAVKAAGVTVRAGRPGVGRETLDL